MYRRDYYDTRFELQSIFEETIDRINYEPDLRRNVQGSISRIRIQTDFQYELPLRINRYTRDSNVILTHSRSISAAEYAMEHWGAEKVAVLSFASATKPGGGVESGSNAQEESICRISTLFPVLSSKRAKEFYPKVLTYLDNYYTDKVLYAPDITIIRNDKEIPGVIRPKERWTNVDIITCAAPNLRRVSIVDHNKLSDILDNRISNIMASAVSYKADTIVLGAFGCGVFKCPPEVVAESFRYNVLRYRKDFKNIIFAIIEDDRTGNLNYSEFQKALKDFL